MGISCSSRPSTHHDDDNDSLSDDFHFSIHLSDENYPEELHLQEQEALTHSSTLSNTNLKQKQKVLETNEDSSSSSHSKASYYCGICMEPKQFEEMFENQNCSNHSFCIDCVGSYLATKIQENVSNVKCPDPKCTSVLEPHNCHWIIPKDVFDRWEHIVCENMVVESQKFYGPFKDCSGLLVNDGEEVVTVSKCPYYHRLFCAGCKVAWHSGVDCKEFQSLKKAEREREDLMAMELAKNKGWKRCPSCKFYVEKTAGCSHIKCRCGYRFCYRCGSLTYCACGL